jgi:hypothetical protein
MGDGVEILSLSLSTRHCEVRSNPRLYKAEMHAVDFSHGIAHSR